MSIPFRCFRYDFAAAAMKLFDVEVLVNVRLMVVFYIAHFVGYAVGVALGALPFTIRGPVVWNM